METTPLIPAESVGVLDGSPSPQQPVKMPEPTSLVAEGQSLPLPPLPTDEPVAPTVALHLSAPPAPTSEITAMATPRVPAVQPASPFEQAVLEDKLDAVVEAVVVAPAPDPPTATLTADGETVTVPPKAEPPAPEPPAVPSPIAASAAADVGAGTSVPAALDPTPKTMPAVAAQVASDAAKVAAEATKQAGQAYVTAGKEARSTLQLLATLRDKEGPPITLTIDQLVTALFLALVALQALFIPIFMPSAFRLFYSLGWGALVGLGLSYLFYSNKKKKAEANELLGINMGLKGVQLVAGGLPSHFNIESKEKLEWLNQLVVEMWPFVDKAICNQIKDATAQMMPEVLKNLPAALKGLVKSIGFKHLTFGSAPFRVESMWVSPDETESLVLELAVKWCGDPNITLAIEVPAGAKLCPRIMDISFIATIRLVLNPLVARLPGFVGAMATVPAPPLIKYRLDFGKAMGGSLAPAAVTPIVDYFIKEAITGMLVWPQRLVVPILQETEEDKVAIMRLMRRHQGVLRVCVVVAKELRMQDGQGVVVELETDNIKQSTSVKNAAIPVNGDKPMVEFHEHLYLLVQEPRNQMMRLEVFDMRPAKQGSGTASGSKSLVGRSLVKLQHATKAAAEGNTEPMPARPHLGRGDWGSVGGTGKGAGRMQLAMTYWPFENITPEDVAKSPKGIVAVRLLKVWGLAPPTSGALAVQMIVSTTANKAQGKASVKLPMRRWVRDREIARLKGEITRLEALKENEERQGKAVDPKKVKQLKLLGETLKGRDGKGPAVELDYQMDSSAMCVFHNCTEQAEDGGGLVTNNLLIKVEHGSSAVSRVEIPLANIRMANDVNPLTGKCECGLLRSAWDEFDPDQPDKVLQRGFRLIREVKEKDKEKEKDGAQGQAESKHGGDNGDGARLWLQLRWIPCIEAEAEVAAAEEIVAAAVGFQWLRMDCGLFGVAPTPVVSSLPPLSMQMGSGRLSAMETTPLIPAESVAAQDGSPSPQQPVKMPEPTSLVVDAKSLPLPPLPTVASVAPTAAVAAPPAPTSEILPMATPRVPAAQPASPFAQAALGSQSATVTPARAPPASVSNVATPTYAVNAAAMTPQATPRAPEAPPTPPPGRTGAAAGAAPRAAPSVADAANQALKKLPRVATHAAQQAGKAYMEAGKEARSTVRQMSKLPFNKDGPPITVTLDQLVTVLFFVVVGSQLLLVPLFMPSVGRLVYSLLWGLVLGLGLSALFYINRKKKVETNELLSVNLGMKGVQLVAGGLPSWFNVSHKEKLEWMNDLILEVWPYIDKGVCGMIKDITAQTMPEVLKTLPAALSGIVKSIGFKHLTFGSAPFRIESMWVSAEDKDRLVMEVAVKWCGDPNITLAIEIPGGQKLCPRIMDISLMATIRIVLNPLVARIPGFVGAMATVPKPPLIKYRLDFGKAMGGSLAPAAVTPVVNYFIKEVITKMLVWPQRLVVPILQETEQDRTEIQKMMRRHKGVLRVCVHNAKQLKAQDWSGTNDCVIELTTDADHPEATTIKRAQADGPPDAHGKKSRELQRVVWNEYIYLLVQEPADQLLRLEAFDIDKLRPGKLLTGQVTQVVNSRSAVGRSLIRLRDVAKAGAEGNTDPVPVRTHLGEGDWGQSGGPLDNSAMHAIYHVKLTDMVKIKVLESRVLSSDECQGRLDIPVSDIITSNHLNPLTGQREYGLHRCKWEEYDPSQPDRGLDSLERGLLLDEGDGARVWLEMRWVPCIQATGNMPGDGEDGATLVEEVATAIGAAGNAAVGAAATTATLAVGAVNTTVAKASDAAGVAADAVGTKVVQASDAVNTTVAKAADAVGTAVAKAAPPGRAAPPKP
ncbi:Synaptotagmin-2 [Tetrabaena socialis]|uniref:Synaptotagmin-2 n=1 Tax=Tetrabaena socialis TaxID=47790 RepID=A0A2J8A833_9CHLO|nr:Synaptotagmin-2 [Tetrabaena socialis]|eukprot:PNH08684.1 Synaptotagmin-2 [Tetrabaena socialis]